MRRVIKEDKKLITNNERRNGLTARFEQFLAYLHGSSGMICDYLVKTIIIIVSIQKQVKNPSACIIDQEINPKTVILTLLTINIPYNPIGNKPRQYLNIQNENCSQSNACIFIGRYTIG